MIRLICCLLLVPVCVGAQPYHLDSTFGTNGIVLGSSTAVNAKLQEVRIQNDGRILTSNSPTSVATSSLSMLRFMPNGKADSSFGTAGVTNVNVSGSGNYQMAGLRLTPTGPMVSGSAGSGGSNFIVYKFTISGAPDPSFGTSGIASANVNFWTLGGDADMQSDGKILVSGTTITTVYTQAQVRLTVAGAPDATYGSLGKVINPFPILNQNCISGNNLASQGIKCIRQPDDKLLVAGTSYSTCNSHVFVARYKTDGTPDSSFGINGLALPSIGTANQNFDTRHIHLDASGNIYVTVAYQDLTTKSVKVVKFTAAGSLVTSYGTNGVATSTAPFLTAYPYWFGAALQPDGKMVIAGTVDTGAANNKACVFRFTPSGQPDASFGTAGTFIITRSQPDVINGAAVQSDTGIVIAGITSGSSGSKPLLMRINNSHKTLAAGNQLNGNGQSVSIYPNPAHQRATVEIQIPEPRVLLLSITNSLGQIAYQTPLTYYRQGSSFISISTSGFPAGVYFVRLISESGGQTVCRLIVD